MTHRSPAIPRALFCLLVLTALLLPASLPAQTSFGSPVLVTPDPGKGYEPALVVDKFGNIYATAHKENWQLVLGPDPNSPTYTRSMSWDWVSVDGGKSFGDLPGLTAASLEQHEFGDEGDMALDDTGHLYFVDTNVTDNTITRWSITGRGLSNITLDFTRPLVPTFQPVDDRPWITAHGNGHAFYFGNEGDKVTYPAGQPGGGNANGPGRYTVYSSYDGGQTFDSAGYTLKDSGWCRPAADHGKNSPYVYGFCTDDGGGNDVNTGPAPVGTLWSYVSADDGHTFNRFAVDTYHAQDSSTSWPTVSVAPDGSLWALYVDADQLTNCGVDPTTGATACDPVTNRLLLYHSTNHGQTWSRQDITPMIGRYRYAWLAVSPDGKSLGVGLYYRTDNNSPWFVYGAIWKPGSIPVLTSIDPSNPVAGATSEAPGDLMGSYFNPDGTLGVIWTRSDPKILGVARISRSIYFARSSGGKQDKGKGQDAKANSFEFQDTAANPATGSLLYNDPSQSLQLQSVNGVRAIAYNGSCVSFAGDALLNSQPGYVYTWSACDLGALGTSIGNFSITVTGPLGYLYQNSATVTSGYISVNP